MLSSLLSSELQPVQPPISVSTCASVFPSDSSTSFDVNTLSIQQSSPTDSEGCVNDASSSGKGPSPSWSTHSSDGYLVPNTGVCPQLDQQELAQLGLFEQDYQPASIVEQQGMVSSPSSSGGDVHIDFGGEFAIVTTVQ